MKRIFILLFLGGIFCANNGLAETLKETVKHVVQTSPETRLILKNTNGSVTLEGWNRNEVYIEAIKIAKGIRYMKRSFEKIRVQIQQENNNLVIQSIFPQRGFSLWELLMGAIFNLRVDYRIKMPYEMMARLKITNGNVTVKQLFGNLLIRITNGNISLTNCQGLIKARATNGNITLSLPHLQSDSEYEVETKNGNIKIQLPTNAQFEIHAHTTNGKIVSDFPLRIKEGLISKELDGGIGKGGPIFLAKTFNGNIYLLVSASHAVMSPIGDIH